MKFPLRIILLFYITLTTVITEAQVMKTNSISVMPVKYYSSDVFRTRDLSLINEWIINTAKEEILFTDSIIKVLTETDKNFMNKLQKKKYLLEFVSENWNEVIRLNAEDGNEQDESVIYSKIVHDSPENVENRFIKDLSDKIREYPPDNKIKFIGNFIRQINKANKTYLDEIKYFLGESIIPDTSLFRLFQSYSYLKYYPLIRKKLDSYISYIVKDKFTKEDSLRGSITPERQWWDVLRYDITVKPDIENKTISGINVINYKVKDHNSDFKMQIDLQSPMIIDSVSSQKGQAIKIHNEKNVWYADIPDKGDEANKYITIYFHGKPKEAAFPPWDGGWVWSKDSLGNPWISVACQGLGASVWYPCKDHLSDEPDNGASLTMMVPDNLKGISNGRLSSEFSNGDGTHSYRWEVSNPVNSYNIVPYIGKYKNISASYTGEKGKLDIELWVLEYNLARAESHSLPDVLRMLTAFE
ncbi:MAG: hypothetical protein WBQ38_02685, partial [Ignavibacteria bacterium]